MDVSPNSVKILLTGTPRCGKTTAVIQILQKLDMRKVAGFYTEEIRVKNTRRGFSWIRLDGASGVLAHVDTKSPYRVGKYRVDIKGFEELVVPVLDFADSDVELFVIDEIGKMECMSRKFVEAVQGLFRSQHCVLATVALKGSGLISEVKRFPRTKLYEITKDSRDNVIPSVIAALAAKGLGA